MATKALYACATCGGSCSGGTCVSFATNDCQDSIVLKESEIDTMLYSCPDAVDNTIPAFKPTDWELDADWTAAITAGLKRVNVVGDIPEPTDEIVTLSKGRKKVAKKTFVANIDIDEWTAANYESMRGWECGAVVFMWFQTRGGVNYRRA